jgi:ACGX-repeat protein
MALSNLAEWTKKTEKTYSSACGTACGASDKREDKGTACGASDKLAAVKSTACGSACGAGDK